MLALEERRAMEVRRDIRLLVLFAALAFVMIAELGYGGVVGKAVSSVMFGLSYRILARERCRQGQLLLLCL